MEAIERRFAEAPPIVQAAITAILDLEEMIDGMGYDIAYYQEDLPRVVKTAIVPWAEM